MTAVHCLGCKAQLDLAEWERDKRLRSSLTLTAALKAQSRPVEFRAAPGFRAPHPWEAEVMFPNGEGFARVKATLYSPRDPDFRGPVAMTAWTATTAEMRAFVGGREFATFEDGRLVGSGVVKPWDVRWLDVAEASERVRLCLKSDFEPRVWFGGVQDIVRRSSAAGLRAECDTAVGKVEMLVFSTAGRCLMQLDTPTSRVTVIADETSPSPRSGIQGIDATEADAVALLTAASDAWVAGGFELRESASVGLG